MAICLRMVNGFTMWKSRPWKVIRICPLFAIRRASFARTATAKAYDVVSKSGAYMSYHWSGENYTLCGWRDPAQYAGAVVIEGTAVKYFPDGSQMPEYTADAEDEITLYEWTWSFEALPATPEKARKRATILPDKVGEIILKGDKRYVQLKKTQFSGKDAAPIYAATGYVDGATFCAVQANCAPKLPILLPLATDRTPVLHVVGVHGEQAFFTLE